MTPGAKSHTARGALAASLVLLSLSSGAEEPEYEIRIPQTAELAPGEASALSLTIAPRPGHTISDDGPVAIDLEVSPPRGLEIPRKHYQRRHAADPRAESPRFDLEVRAATPGDYRVSVSLRFWVCARRTCRPVHETRRVEVTVKAPPPDAGPVFDAGEGPRPTTD